MPIARALRRSRERFEAVFHASPVPMGFGHQNGQIVAANRRFVELTGYQECELVDRPLTLLWVSSADGERILRAVTARAPIRNLGARLRTRSGQACDVLVTVEVVNVRGRSTFIMTLADRTERGRPEGMGCQSQELAGSGPLLATLVHELNNPLTAILGYAGLLRSGEQSERVAAHAHRIAEAANYCSRVVKNFVAAVRGHPPEWNEVPLNDVVHDAVTLLDYHLRASAVEVSLDLATDLPGIWGDRQQLHQVVANLVMNARDAMRLAPPPRRLTLATRVDVLRGTVALEVTDTGPGVSSSVRDRIFEPFFTTKPLEEGTGLGLALCHGIVTAHGGAIRLEHLSGPGATFRVELPIVRRLVSAL